MKIAKPLLLITTPIGMAGGLHEAWRLVGGFAFLMLLMMAVLAMAAGSVVATIRREQRADGERP